MNEPTVFRRKIISRELTPEGFEEIKLECGHEVTIINPSQIKLDTNFCAECVNEFVEKHNREKPERGRCG
jgi:hypothetical protein